MAIRVESGPARVIAAGSATCFMGHPLTLRILDPVPFAVEMNFLSDEDVEDVEVNFAEQEGGLRMICVNFDSAIGRGSAVPVLLGGAEKELLFLHFRVFRYGRTDDRTVHYTFYAVDKEEVNWTEAGESE